MNKLNIAICSLIIGAAMTQTSIYKGCKDGSYHNVFAEIMGYAPMKCFSVEVIEND